jgi:histidinol dehydrogenase
MVGIDMIAGPSEILVVADAANDPAWIAADLLSQAEHDESAQSILITDDDGFADAVAAAVETELKNAPREGTARASWTRHGADHCRPHHGRGARADRCDRARASGAGGRAPEVLAARVRNAGAIFLGRHTPEAIGDYVAGPNHVLPTARSARFASGLSVMDFMKRTTLVQCDADALAAIGPAAIALAEAEGLPRTPAASPSG